MANLNLNDYTQASLKESIKLCQQQERKFKDQNVKRKKYELMRAQCEKAQAELDSAINATRSITMASGKSFYEEYIEKSLMTYISYRFEEQARNYFSLSIKNSKLKGIKNIGTYYYDDSKTKTNGEFDVVLEKEDGFVIYEVKYLKNKMEESVKHLYS